VNDAADLLRDRSRSYLLDLGLDVEQDLTGGNATPPEREKALALGRALFTQVNALLKSTLDAQDLPTFTEAERDWARMFEDQYVPREEVEPEGLVGIEAGAPTNAVRTLVRYRETLWLGLAMWAAHLYEKKASEQRNDMRIDALRILSQHFPDVEDLLATYERASEGEEEDRLPWSDWFLSELPTREAHWMPTQRELLFATVLLTTLLTPPDPPALKPKAWVIWRDQDITGALKRLDEQAAVWSILIPVPTLNTGLATEDPQSLQWWHDRVATVRDMFARLKADTEAEELAKLRDAPLDPDRVGAFRSHLLENTRQSRPIVEIFRVQSEVERLDEPPEAHTPMSSRSWMPKSFFTPDSRVIGLDMAAGDLARVTANAEITQLLAVLPSVDPRTSDEPVASTVAAAIDELRGAGRRPSLIVIPIGWDLRRALGIQGWRALPEAHPLIPLTRRRDFEGVFNGVPVIDFPHVPTDRLWVLDLAGAARYREWPSDEDSGIHFELQPFDEPAAVAMLAEHPEVRADGHTDMQAIHSLQERLLLTMTMCWEIVAHEADAAIPIAIPSELQRH